MGIKINENQNIFSIETKNTSYIFGVDNLGLIMHLNVVNIYIGEIELIILMTSKCLF